LRTLWYVVYVAAHLLLYFAVLRHLPAFRTERTILLYHAVSAVGLTLVVVGRWLMPGSGVDVAWVAAVVALHGIYSVSFLEIWSLADGGYSLQILEHVERAERLGQQPDVEALRAVGRAKQENRLAGLVAAGLVREEAGRMSLTGAGRVVASLFAALAWLTHTQDGV
jgi:hypothetical protein